MASPSPASKPAESKRKNKASIANKVQLNGNHAPAPSVDGAADVSVNGGESSYVREIEKRIRNVNKKISAMQKVESIVAEYPGSTLDQLVAKNVINKDQREQVLKKPSLVSQLSSLQEQREQFTKFEEDLKIKHDADKQELEAKYEADLKAARADASKERDGYLVISKFLCAAAARRGELVEGEEEDDDTQAFEGLLLALYAGSSESVDAMQKLVAGADEPVPSVNGTPTNVNFKRVKELSLPHGSDGDAATNAQAEPAVEVDAPIPAQAASTDPTVANAGLTELDSQLAASATAAATAVEAPETTAVDEGAANAAAAQQWDESKGTAPTDMGDSWVAVPRDPSEVENTASGTAGSGQTQAWADEPMAESAPTSSTPTPVNDGFHEVQHSRGGRRGGGNAGGRGGGRGGGYRGRGNGFRGGRGDGSRGRGRGRGGRGD